MPDLSEIKRKRMLDFLEAIKENIDKEGIKAVNEIENFLREKSCGLVWEGHEEEADLQMAEKIPVFAEEEQKKIIHDPSKKMNFLLEGDNLHSLFLLEKTHRGKD